MKQEKLKVGLIVDSNIVSKYVYEIAYWLKTQEDIEFSHLIIQNIPEENLSISLFVKKFLKHIIDKRLKSIFQKITWDLITSLEKIKLQASHKHSNHFSNRDIRSLADQIRVKPILSKNRLVYRYDDNDIKKIRAQKFDILIRFGSGILLGDILDVSRLGVISFHHADNRFNRGGPAGFWEVYNNEAQTGFVIQKLTEELDGGDVIFRGAFPTLSYYLLNQANLYYRANQYLIKVLKFIAINKKLPKIEPRFPYCYQLSKHPPFLIQAKYFLKLIWNFMKLKINSKITKNHNRWSIAFQRRNWRDLVMWKAVKIDNPPGRFFADPFVISKNGIEYCFVEDYNFSLKRGCISVLQLGQAGVESMKTVISETFHMSFPYLFEYESKIFMVPETSENKDIRVYECVDFPLNWKLREVIIEGVSAADNMIFLKDGLWWLFTNIDPLQDGDHCSELFIYFSNNPLSKNWMAHPLNPVYVDPSRARNGGILLDGDQFFRVVQKHGFNKYGVQSRIFRIDKLDTQSFEESLVAEVKPNFFNAAGTHHLHSNGTITVFDYLSK